MIAMPKIVQMRTSNFSDTPISHDLFVWHMMEGGYAGSISWLCNPIAKASAQFCQRVDGEEVTQLAPLNRKAWHACAFNGRGVGYEIEGFTAHGLADVTLNAAALAAAWYCLAYGVPPVWAEGGRGRGICTHHDLGLGGGGHTDICGVGDTLWTRAVAATQNAYEALEAQGLPAWALNGAPGPHEIVATPYVPGTVSHGGAARNEPGDVINHPTISGYAAHSVTALQADLNKIGETANYGWQTLDVDGGVGPKTTAILKAFQAKRGLAVDGLPGPKTWAALDSAIAGMK